MRHNAVDVSPYLLQSISEDREQCIVVQARRRLTEPLPLTGDDIVSIPSGVRRELEGAIEIYADLLSVKHQSPRRLQSPQPYISIQPIDEDALRYFSGKRIEVFPGSPPQMTHDITMEQCCSMSEDRLDGLSLLAEAINHTHPTGQLHEFMRLFERAFAASAGHICRRLLYPFLDHAGRGYTHSEVMTWLDLRDSTAHADRRVEFAMEQDTRRVISRMEQAAYDVLFNKAAWRSKSLERRKAFSPVTESIDSRSGLFVTRGKNCQVRFSPTDGFDAYPFNTQMCLEKVPENWITATVSQGLDECRPPSRRR